MQDIISPRPTQLKGRIITGEGGLFGDICISHNSCPCRIHFIPRHTRSEVIVLSLGACSKGVLDINRWGDCGSSLMKINGVR